MKHCDTEQFIMSFSFIQSKAKPFQFHLVLLCKICEIGHVIFLPISTQRISLEIIILSVTEPFTVANYYEIQNTEYPPSLRIDCMSYLTEGNHCRFAEVPLQDIPHITGTDPTTLSVVWTSLATCHVSRVTCPSVSRARVTVVTPSKAFSLSRQYLHASNASHCTYL